jgi:hypothetical protein
MQQESVSPSAGCPFWLDRRLSGMYCSVHIMCTKQYTAIADQAMASRRALLVSSANGLGRKLVAIAVASLLAGPAPAKIASLGIIMHAERAHVGEAAASAGGTIFAGDRLSTDAEAFCESRFPP